MNNIVPVEFKVALMVFYIHVFQTVLHHSQGKRWIQDLQVAFIGIYVCEDTRGCWRCVATVASPPFLSAFSARLADDVGDCAVTLLWVLELIPPEDEFE